ncbi:MAG: ankyrin repeat domain-containing protein [Deltaproteobacteria bacterium]|nr:ankyrin repeat domain-containing protein [Deltaproteobacteria bacterium]
MSKKWIGVLIALVLVGAFAAWFVLHGRYVVEGGRAPWAVINERPDVLKEALAAGIDKEEMDEAFGRAVGRSNLEALEMLLEAGASPNPAQKGRCYLDGSTRHGRVKVSRLLLERGADPRRCQTDPSTMMAFLVAYGAGEAPQGELIGALAPLVAAGGSADKTGVDYVGSALQEAEKRKLDQVVAYLKDPTAAPGVAQADGEQPRGKSGSLELDDLKRVCAGEGLADAAPYVKQAGRASLVYYFERRSDEYRWPGRGPGRPSLPRWWTSWEDPSHTQLVACVDLSEKKKVQDCRYEGGGGGISVYDAKVKMTLYEAKTGRRVDARSFDKSGPRCPIVKSGSEQEGLYPSYSKELEAFLAPHVCGPS